MEELPEQAPRFNNNTPIWSAEHPLNQRNSLRIEIVYLKGSPILHTVLVPAR